MCIMGFLRVDCGVFGSFRGLIFMLYCYDLGFRKVVFVKVFYFSVFVRIIFLVIFGGRCVIMLILEVEFVV